MKNPFSLLSIFFSLTLLTGCGGGNEPAGDQAILEYEWRPGVTYVQNMSMHQETSFKMGGQNMDQDMRMEMVIRMPVTETDTPGEKRLEVSYDRIKMTMKMQGQELMYDSANPEASHPMMAAGMEPLTQAGIAMIVNERGDIVDIQGMESLLENHPPEARESLEQFLNKDALAQMTNLWLREILPGKPIAKGDSWDVDVEMALPQMGNIGMKGTMTHKGREDLEGKAAVRIDMDMDLNIDFSSIENPQMKAMSMEIQKGHIAGDMLWSLEYDFPVVVDMEQTFTMTMKNPMDGSRIEVPMKQTLQVKTTLE